LRLKILIKRLARELQDFAFHGISYEVHEGHEEKNKAFAWQ